MKTAVRGFLILALSFLVVQAQAPVPIPAGPAADVPEASAMSSRLPGLGPSQAPQAYDKVITKEAKSKTGVFTVHEVNEKYYYEIPKTELNREFLMVTQIARTTLGVGYGGQCRERAFVRWERNGNKINLREVNYDVVADPKTPISLAVKAANNDAIIMSFPIAAFGKEKGSAAKAKRARGERRRERNTAGCHRCPKNASEGPTAAAKPDAAKIAAVSAAKPPIESPALRSLYKETGREPSVIIEVTRLFTTDVFEFSANQRLNATMMDSSRSYIERISPYPENIEVEATATYSRMPAPLGIPRNPILSPLPACGLAAPPSSFITAWSNCPNIP